jgi:hypothetical protein
MKKSKRARKERRTAKKCWMLLKHAIENVYFVFTLELILLLLINCVSEMVVMKKGEQQKPTILKEKERTRDMIAKA